MLAELNNIQQTNKTDIHEHCIRHGIQYLILPWWLSGLILVSKLLSVIFSKSFWF